MVTNGSEEISSGTGWKCQAMKHFKVSPDCTLPSNRDDNHRYYRCNLGKVMKECEETTSQAGWKCRTPKNYLKSSNTSIPVYSSIDDAFEAASRDGSSFADVIRILGNLVELRYRKIRKLAASAVNEIRRHWFATDGTYFHRAKVVNKLIGYYLVSIAIYVIELSFWTNGKLFRLLGNLVLEQRDNTRVLIALCITAVFVLVVYLLGGEGTLFASSVCENYKM